MEEHSNCASLSEPVTEWAEAIRDGLAWVVEQTMEQTPTREALRRLPALQSKHPEMDIDLVWEQEDYSGAIHYDLLIRPDERGTISLSYCADRAVPWPLRNAFRSPDGWVVRVNGRVIDAPTLMTNLDAVWEKSDIVRGIIHLGLIEEGITRRGLKVEPEELQAAMDGFRRSHGLLRKEQLLTYLEEHGIPQTRLEENLERQVQEEKLKEAVTAGKVEVHFDGHRADFETASVARFKVATLTEANRIAGEIEAGRTSFFEAAREQFLAEGSTGPTFATLRRSALTEEQQNAIFGAQGRVVVTSSGKGFDVVEILRIDAAVLDEATREKVKQAVFDKWLNEERRQAQITWYWGDPAQLPGQKNGWAG